MDKDMEDMAFLRVGYATACVQWVSDFQVEKARVFAKL